MKKTYILIRACLCSLMTGFIALFYCSITVFATEEPVKPSFNSVIEVDSYLIEEDYLEPGKIAHVVLTIRNANTYSAANGLVVGISSNSGMIYPAYGNDNQFFIGTLEANDTATITMPLITNSKLTGDYVDFSCTMVYVIGGVRFTNVSTMILPTKSNINLAVDSLDVSTHATVMGKSLLSISYHNNGTESINDAVLTVDGSISESTKKTELGTVAAGKSYTKDYNIIFVEAGEQEVSITLSYTDENGEAILSDLGTYKVNVGSENQTGVDGGANNGQLVLIGKVIAAIAFLAAAGVSLLYVIKR